MSTDICYVGNWWEADKGFWAKGGKSTIGVCVCNYHNETGALEPTQEVSHEVCVGAQCLSVKKNTLYAADEKLADPDFRVGGGGAICSFKIDSETGRLTPLNRVSSLGVLTSYVALDPAEEYLVATNHSSHNYVSKVIKNDKGDYEVKVEHDDATIVLYKIEEDGSIGRACDVYYCHGTGPLGQQTLSHLHSVYFSPLNDFLLVCDKGGDLIHTLRIDREAERLVACCEAFHTEPGTMPRYAAFHPSKPYVYTNNEAEPILHCFKYDETGKLELIEVVSGIGDEIAYDGTPYTIKQSDLKISNDGKYLYSCVRDVNAISVYEICQKTGKLTMVQCKQIDDKDPHSCCLSPDGNFLLIGALGTHEVVSYQILENGTLGSKVASVHQPSACSIVFGK